ncbi:MAG: ABC-2 family transporter protein [Defluviitaleaceae bacterium]|nr:ABC-2 family transporter protein [Defluviitaleaceae bacterium]
MVHTYRCYKELVAAYWKSRFVHPLSPVIHTVGLGLIYFSSFLGLWIILERLDMDTIGYWTRGQIVFIYGLSLAAYGVRCLFFIPFTDLGTHINSGAFDRFLLRPVNSFVQIMGTRFDPGSFAHIGFGLLMIWIFRGEYGFDWTPSAFLWLGLAIISGGVAQGAITVVIGTCGFFMQNTGSLNDLYGNLRNFVWYPVTLFNRFIQFVLFFVIPLAFSSYVPAGVLLSNAEYDALPIFIWRMLLLVPFLLLALSYQFWKFGLSRYKSTGS